MMDEKLKVSLYPAEDQTRLFGELNQSRHKMHNQVSDVGVGGYVALKVKLRNMVRTQNKWQPEGNTTYVESMVTTLCGPWEL
jgi:hypothetical protein